MYLKKLNEQLDQFHLLNHPFYIAWNNGELNQEILQDYAEQYYQHIKAFPRYISATHSICEDIENRKIKLSVKAVQIDEEKSLIAKFGEGATKSGATLKGIFEKAIGKKGKKEK